MVKLTKSTRKPLFGKTKTTKTVPLKAIKSAKKSFDAKAFDCLLYTSDAADE